MQRKTEDWLDTLTRYVEDTEAPRHFWLWSGIFTIACALQRRVWLPYGIQTIYPNLYVLVIAPPGGRKGGPVGFSRDILQELGHFVSADSLSKRRLTGILHEVSAKAFFDYKGKPKAQAPLALISKEMSSLLALDPKVMIEVLTDLFDSHDKWDYETSGAGMDNIRGVCISCMAASTPTWISNNLPTEAIGGGFTSRCVLVYGDTIYKEVPIPDELDPAIYNVLCKDLNAISTLRGEFTWDEGTRATFTRWYGTIREKTSKINDVRIHPFMSRIHVVVLKVAMALHCSYANNLVLTGDDINRAIAIVEDTVGGASEALGGMGRSTSSQDVENILRQVRLAGTIGFTRLLQMNYRNTNKQELEIVLETACNMGYVQEVVESNGTKNYRWVGKRKET